MTTFIFRDIFPNIGPEVNYCTNIYAAANNSMDEYKSVHKWLNENNTAFTEIYSSMPHYGFIFSDIDKEADFIEKFKDFMAPVEVDGQT